MRGWIFNIGMALSLAILCGAGLVHGRLSHRWGAPFDLRAAGERIDRFPARFGDWEMISSEPLEERARRLLECTGSFHRVYRNSKSQERVSVALLVGPPGPVAIHVPEICYSSQNYEMVEGPVRFAVPRAEGGQDEFRGMTFRAPDVSASELLVCFAWNDGIGWQVPEQPRLRYGGKSFLYKLQIATDTRPTRNKGQDDPRVAFLKEFLPLAQSTVESSSSDS